MENTIDITGVDLKEFVKEVYALSRPQGMGFFHYTEGGLSDEDASAILDRDKDSPRFAFRMDYVHGRACKMNAWKEDEKLFINDRWYDHSDYQLVNLLKKFGKAMPKRDAA